MGSTIAYSRMCADALNENAGITIWLTSRRGILSTDIYTPSVVMGLNCRHLQLCTSSYGSTTLSLTQSLAPNITQNMAR